MFRYIALCWDSRYAVHGESTRRLASRILALGSDWQRVFSTDGMLVFCAGASPNTSMGAIPLRRDSGVVLGTVFKRTTSESAQVPRRVETFAEREGEAIVNSDGEALVSAFWGRYVAFIRGPNSRTSIVFRDPSGALPCFKTNISEVTVFFSCVSDCMRLPGARFTINWRYLGRRVAGGVGEFQHTGLEEVSELRAGEAIRLHHHRAERRFYWHPFEIARSGIIDDPSRALIELRSAVHSCAYSWASCFDRLIHELSGGLDSSIVLACLQDAPTRPSITSLTWYVSGGNSDERPYARLAAQRTGCEHLELARDANLQLNGLVNATPWVNPAPNVEFLEKSATERRLAAERNATAIFTGVGGDMLFGSDIIEFAAEDYARRHWIGPSVLRVSYDVAVLTNRSIWKVLSGALKEIYSPRTCDFLKEIASNRTLATEDIIHAMLEGAAAEDNRLVADDSVAPSTLLHAMGVTMPRLPYDLMCDPADPRGLEQIDPLLSQPVVEMCLRIPSYLHILGRQDRGLARKAFSGSVPDAIIRRQWKDRGASYAHTVLNHNLNFIRQLLLDGNLVKQRLLDREKLELALSNIPAATGGYITEIFDHVISEAWTQTWVGIDKKAAA